MDFLKNLDLRPLNILKVAGVIVLGIILLSFVFKLVASSFQSITGGMGMGGSMGYATPSYPGTASYDASYASDYAKGESAMPQLSARNVAGIMPPMPGGTVGNNAEDFDVTQYSARIETRKLEETCNAFIELKARKDVIFESANSYDRGCDYTFKVEHASVEGILVWLRDLKPKELSENTYTIKRQIDDFTSEEDVLKKKRASIDDTLAKALSAYDEITRLATNTQNADALAKIIDSKIGIIERLTQERININEQLDRLARAKADQLDQLEYTYFNVSVYENKFVDGEQLGDSWKEAFKNFVRELNKIVQDVTVGLVLLLFFIAQWLLYAAIVLIVAKYGWKVAKYIWYR